MHSSLKRTKERVWHCRMEAMRTVDENFEKHISKEECVHSVVHVVKWNNIQFKNCFALTFFHDSQSCCFACWHQHVSSNSHNMLGLTLLQKKNNSLSFMLAFQMQTQSVQTWVEKWWKIQIWEFTEWQNSAGRLKSATLKFSCFWFESHCVHVPCVQVSATKHLSQPDASLLEWLLRTDISWEWKWIVKELPMMTLDQGCTFSLFCAVCTLAAFLSWCLSVFLNCLMQQFCILFSLRIFLATPITDDASMMHENKTASWTLQNVAWTKQTMLDAFTFVFFGGGNCPLEMEQGKWRQLFLQLLWLWHCTSHCSAAVNSTTTMMFQARITTIVLCQALVTNHRLKQLGLWCRNFASELISSVSSQHLKIATTDAVQKRRFAWSRRNKICWLVIAVHSWSNSSAENLNRDDGFYLLRKRN